MTLRSVFKLSEKFIIDNAPTLLSAVAVTGTATIAYLTGKATFKAAKILETERQDRNLQELREDEEITRKDAIKLTWKCYIPPAMAVVGTAGCIVFANSISASRLAGMAAAYKISEKHYAEYRDKVKEILGERTDEKVRDAAHKDIIANDPYGLDEAWDVSTKGGKALCYDNWNGRYFRSDKQTLEDARNFVNYEITHNMYCTLADYYQHLGLSSPKGAGQIGWTTDHMLQLEFSSQLQPSGEPTLVVDFSVPPTPIADFGRFQS